jgi:DNA-binding CsgD family transcriptional regulator
MVDRWPLTGRGEELRIMGEALAHSEHKGVVVAGQAGVGKTRLGRAAADAAARSGWAVRRIAGTATGQAVTLGAFARWADLTDASPLALARNVFAGLTGDTAGAQLLLLVDDAHLLDDLSALIVHQLVIQDVARVIATIRTAHTAPDAVTALWKDGLLRRLELQPLSRNESDHLLQTVLDGPISPDCAERMWVLSRGNVLFLHHLVEHERETGRLALVEGEWRSTATPSASPSLIELVEHQIGAIPDGVREVVDLVAIAEPIEREILAGLADPQSIEDAEQRELIMTASTGDAVYVGHPLYGEIRLSQCGPLRLKRLRGRVATAIAGTDTVDPLRLGLLWLESDLPPDIEILSRAANISASRLDLGLAERLARAAVEVQPDPVTKLALAYILYLQEKGEQAEEILDSLDSHDMVIPGFVDGVIVRAANLLGPLRNPDESRSVIETALRLGDDERNPSLRTFRAVQQAMAAEPLATIQTMAAVDYDRLDSHGRVTGISAEIIALGDIGRIDQAGQRATEGYRVLDESPLDSFHSTGLAEFHAYALLAAGCVAEAQAVAERQHRRYAEFPGQSRSMAVAALGMTALAQGDLLAALRHLSSAADSFGDYGDISGLFYRFRILYTEALARSGDIEAAVASLEATDDARHPAYPYVESGYLLAAAWVSANQGRTAEARELASRAAQFTRVHGQAAREVVCLQTAVQFGDASGGDRLNELAGKVQGPRAPLAAQYARALADDDAARLDAVSDDLESMGDALAAADASAQAATSHRRAGNRGSALTASARAHKIAKDCGDAISPALAAARVPLPFTRREHEIAKLLSHGLSNKDIAEAMSVSVRTVEGHIYQASTKAGVTSRSELSELVQQFNEAEA